jgi:hypothetical protein
LKLFEAIEKETGISKKMRKQAAWQAKVYWKAYPCEDEEEDEEGTNLWHNSVPEYGRLLLMKFTDDTNDALYVGEAHDSIQSSVIAPLGHLRCPNVPD